MMQDIETVNATRNMQWKRDMEIGNWKLKLGSQEMETGNLKLETGNEV